MINIFKQQNIELDRLARKIFEEGDKNTKDRLEGVDEDIEQLMGIVDILAANAGYEIYKLEKNCGTTGTFFNFSRIGLDWGLNSWANRGDITTKSISVSELGKLGKYHTFTAGGETYFMVKTKKNKNK